MKAVLRGDQDAAAFRDNPGIIDAEIVEEAGRILMRKICEKHGPFEDTLSNHSDFFQKMERLAFGRDFECVDDSAVHNHGPNSIQTGRGSYLTVDITNRCNMKCSPCFMDANASGYVYELNLTDVKTLFDNAVSFKPRREINVLFSGGEATISPIFLDAIRYARSMGFEFIHVATNGIRFAESRDLAFEASAAGLRGVYLQFDGVTEEKNKHRGLGNYIEVKNRALENISAAGMWTTLQVTVENGLNNDGMGAIAQFAIEHADRIHAVIFHPLMFAGRDAHTSAEDRYARRYPLSQLAYDLQSQSSIDWHPMRDWLPASAYAAFTHLSDLLNPTSELGGLFPEPHPDHSIISALLVDTEMRKAVPVAAFFDLEQFMRDIAEITDAARLPGVTKSLVRLSALRNFDQKKAPAGIDAFQLLDAFEKSFYRFASSGVGWSRNALAQTGRWRVMLFTGMWFPDAFNYDLSVMHHSITPVATPLGEISFSAYYGGGWREIVEHQGRAASLTEWHRTHRRHEIYANGRQVDLEQSMYTADAQLVQIEPEPLAVENGG